MYNWIEKMGMYNAQSVLHWIERRDSVKNMRKLKEYKNNYVSILVAWRTNEWFFVENQEMNKLRLEMLLNKQKRTVYIQRWILN